MKAKTLLFLMIALIITSIIAIPVMAANKVVDITRPEGNETVYKDIFSICGVCTDDETTIELYYKDREASTKDKTVWKALDIVDTDTNVFKVGGSKFFGKDIELKKGDNEIKIVSKTKAYEQENTFTITLAEKKGWIQAVMGKVKEVFGSNTKD